MTARNKQFNVEDDRWRSLRDRINLQTAPVAASPPPTTVPQAKKIEASLRFTVPHIPLKGVKRATKHTRKLLKFLALKLFSRKRLVPLAVLLILSFGFSAYRNFSPTDNPEAPTAVAGEKELAVPMYTPVVPQAGHGTKPQLRYDANKKVTSFKDSVGEVPVTVSQQPLPENFKINPDQQLEDTAKSFSANESITADGTKAYIGTSIKGPQSVILYKNDLLIFIQSTQMVTKEQWTAYIANLK